MRAHRLEVGHGRGQDLIARYEQLRREGVKGVTSREMAIFIGQGMYAWMCAWVSHTVEPDVGWRRFAEEERAKKEEHKNTGVLPLSVHAEAVSILATMSLEKLKEVQV